MATSPIYSWPEPDNTDLVKNGALAIRTLGNAIDTTMATMVPKTIVDAKGDLIAGTAADTAARLAVGSDGSILQADSTAATGLRYTTLNPLPNPFTNSAFDIWQRGTSFTAGNYIYTADRWTFQRQAGTAGGTISRQTTSDTTNLPNIQYCARVQRDSGNTSTSFLQLINSMETVNCIPFAGKTVTFSFYARAGANYSATSNLLTATLETGTGTDQNRASVSYTGSNASITSNVTLTTTWQRFTLSGTIPTTATEFCAFFRFTPTGTAGANDYFEITGVSVDLGSSTAATLPTFSRSSETIQGELAACQRYYYLHASGNTVPICTTGNYSTTLAIGWLGLPVTMRTAPTLVAASGSAYYSIDVGGAGLTFSAPTIAAASTTSVRLDAAVTGATLGYAGYLRTNNASASIAFNSEL